MTDGVDRLDRYRGTGLPRDGRKAFCRNPARSGVDHRLPSFATPTEGKRTGGGAIAPLSLCRGSGRAWLYEYPAESRRLKAAYIYPWLYCPRSVFECCEVASYYSAGYRFATSDVAILWRNSMKGQRALRCSSKRLCLDGDMRQGRESSQSFLVEMRFVRAGRRDGEDRSRTPGPKLSQM